MTVAAIAADRASDVDYPVECGEHPSSIAMRNAEFSVEYESVDLDGQPTGARLLVCRYCLGTAVNWALAYNKNAFVPPTVSPLASPVRAA